MEARELSVGYVPMTFPRDPIAVDQFDEHIILGQILEPLVDADGDGKIIPSIAEQWRFSADGLSIHFTLNRSASFSNGKQILAKDVVYSLSRHLNSSSQSSSFLSDIKAVNEVSEYEVILELRHRNEQILKVLTRDQLGIVPDGWEFDAGSHSPFIGSGPYNLTQNSGFWYLVANSYFRREDVPVNKWRLIFFKDSEFNLPEELPSVVSSATIGIVEKMKQLPGYNPENSAVNQRKGYSQTSLWVFPEGKLYRDKTLRKMIQSILNDALESFSKNKGYPRSSGMIPDGILGCLKEGIQLVPGMKNPNPVEISIAVPGNLMGIIFTDALIDHFNERYNVQLKIFLFSPSEISKMYSQKPDLVMGSWAGGFNDPTGFLSLLKIIFNQTFESYLGEMGRVLTEAKTESSLAKRNELYQKLGAWVIAEGFLIPGWQVKTYELVSKSLKNMNRQSRFTPRFINYTRMKKPLSVAFMNFWGSLSPADQHTLVGDLLLLNQFQPLVGQGQNGSTRPLAAKTWDISADFKTYTFAIDTEMRFSDGEKLTSFHFKESWINSVLTTPKSLNSSILDVLYMIEGFDEYFPSSISGIHTPDVETLILKFKKPFRLALEHLKGVRLAAYRQVGGNFLGTGKYVLTERSKVEVHATPNVFYPEQERSNHDFMISVVPTQEAPNEIKSGKIDALVYGMGSRCDFEGDAGVKVVVGEAAGHECVQLNSNKGHIFEKQSFRQALQYLLYSIAQGNSQNLGFSKYVGIDFQPFVLSQYGRISDEEVHELINQGKQYLDDLIAQTQIKPIYAIYSKNMDIIERLKEKGLVFSEKSHYPESNEYFEFMYRSTEPDLLFGGYSVSKADPDGLYHRLGRNGAIASAMIVPRNVADLLEEGRTLTTRIDPFYQTVSRQFLVEVPLIHLGTSKAIAMYNERTVQLSEKKGLFGPGYLDKFEAKSGSDGNTKS